MNTGGTKRNSNGASDRLAPPTSVSFPSPSPATSNNYDPATAASTTATSSSTTDGACLRATIMTAYDLPLRDPPSSIRLTLLGLGQTLVTGPPIQRHKDRNSFRFHSNLSQQSGSSTLVIRSNKLEELYNDTAIFTVEYPHTASTAGAATKLTARYKLSQLNIHEATWLILSLDDYDDDDDDDASVSSSDNTEPEEGKELQTGAAATEPEHTSSVPSPSPSPAAAAATGQDRKSSSIKRGGNRSVSSRSNNRRMNDTFSLGWEGEAEDDGLPPPPSLRLQLTLEGPYRPEVSAVISLFDGWLSIADRFQGMFDRVALEYFAWWDTKLLLVPAVPLFAAGVVATPLVVGLCVTFLPMLLPLAVLFSVLMMGIAIVVGILYASTRKGREHVGGILQPLLRGILSTKTGQRMVYDTGPRPTPVALCRTFILPQDMWGRLLVSLTLDGLGSASFLVPILGEVVDVVLYAHLQTLFVMAMYDEIAPNLKYISFLEEFLPFTDLMPSATLGWLKEYGWIPLVHMILQNDKVAATTSSIQRRKRHSQDRLRILSQQGTQALTAATRSPKTTTTPLTANTSSAKRQ